MFLEKAFKGVNNRWYLYVFTVILVFLATQIASIPALWYSGMLGGKGSYETLVTPDEGLNDSQATLNTLQESSNDIQEAVENSPETPGVTDAHAAETPSSPTNGPASRVDVIYLALMLLPFAVALLVLVVCIRYLHGKRPVDAFTGRTRLDIKRCLYAALVWGGLTLVITGVQCIVDHSTLRFQFDLLPFLGTCLVLIIFLPFQVAWEECLFRGYLMQGFAALFAYRWIPLVLTSVIFGLMHSANPEIDRFGFWITMPQYILMGLILGYVTIKDGGIELALGLHLANNLLVSLLVTHEASALPTSALFIDTDPSISPSDILVTVVCGIIFIWLCNRKYRFIPGEKLEGKVKKEDYVVPLACETEHDQTKDFNS